MILAGGKDPKKIGAMFSSIAPTYDSLNNILSFWQDVKWRRRLIRGADLPHDGLVLDLCTGSGDIALGFLTDRLDFEGFVYGIDFSALMIDIARSKLARLGAPYPRMIEFLMGDALNLSFPDDKFDVVTVGFGVRNFVNTEEGMKEIFRVLKGGGQANILEFFRDGITFVPVRLYTDIIAPWLGNMISQGRAYSYLRSSASRFYRVREFEELLWEIGFSDIVWERMIFGVAYIVRARK